MYHRDVTEMSHRDIGPDGWMSDLKSCFQHKTSEIVSKHCTNSVLKCLYTIFNETNINKIQNSPELIRNDEPA